MKERREFKDYVSSTLYLKSNEERRNNAVLSGLMTPEDYYELRVLPLLDEFEREESRLRLYTRCLQISSMILSSAAVVLGSANEVNAIPAVIGTFLASHEAYCAFSYPGQYLTGVPFKSAPTPS